MAFAQRLPSALRRLAHEALHEGAVRKGIVGAAVDHQQHGAAVAVVVSGGQHIELQVVDSGTLPKAPREAVVMDQFGARAQHTAAGFCL